MLKEYFIVWMRKNLKIKERSVYHYVNAINSISKLLVSKNIYDKSLFEINSIDELISISNYLKTDNEFLKKDSTGNNMYSAGFHHYLSFISGEKAFISQDGDIVYIDVPIKKSSKALQHSTFWKRNSIILMQSLRMANFCCEYDNTHRYFISKVTGQNFVEGHHIIPIMYQDNYNSSLDVYANIISLCPVCHSLLHHGRPEDKEPLLGKIISDRETRLRNSGIIINLFELEKMY